MAQWGCLAVRLSMNADDLKGRTKQFALRVVRFVEGLPSTKACNVIGGQLLKAGTSVGANYRASCRAKSRPDFISKMKIVEEECDESIYWVELLVALGPVNTGMAMELISEGKQILSIVVASIKTARSHNSNA